MVKRATGERVSAAVWSTLILVVLAFSSLTVFALTHSLIWLLCFGLLAGIAGVVVIWSRQQIADTEWLQSDPSAPVIVAIVGGFLLMFGITAVWAAVVALG